MSTENHESEPGLSRGLDTEDGDPSNMLFRAGYILGLAMRLEGMDREMLLRASRSLRIAAKHV